MKEVFNINIPRSWLFESKSEIINDYQLYLANFDTKISLLQYWRRYRNQYIRYRNSHICVTFYRK